LSLASRCIKGGFIVANPKDNTNNPKDGTRKVKTRYIRASDASTTNIITTPPPAGTKTYILPVLDDNNGTLLRRILSTGPPDFPALGSAYIFFFGFINLGEASCSRCRLQGAEPFLACASAPGYCHGVCVSGYILGEDLGKSFATCSISRFVPFPQFDQMLVLASS
jgi:hypothetical protein